MTNPLILDAEALKRLQPPALQQLPPMQAQAPQPIAMPPGPNPLAMLPTPAMPTVSRIPNEAEQNSGTSLLGHQQELKRLTDTGSGVSQIKNPFLRTLGRIGDVAESAILPTVARITPGTTMNHDRLVGQQQWYVNNDLENQHQQASNEQLGALTDYTRQRPDIEQSKIDQKQTAVQERVGQLAASRGQTVSWGSDGLPVFADDHTSQAFADHQALSAMHQATADKSGIMADIAKNHYIPGTPEFTEAQRKLDAVDKRLNVAVASLGLRAQGLDLRRQNTNAALYGTDNAGIALPGAAQIMGDNGQQTTVGAKFGPNAEKQQKTVTSFNDLTGSVGHLRNAIRAYESEGGDMSDARLAQAATDPHSVVGKVINGKLVTNGLSPAAITLLNAQRQTMEQAGILRSTTGGTSSEAGAQRILAVVPQFGSDTNASAYNKLDEQENVLNRLAPGQTSVHGGQSVRHPGKTPQTFRQTATGSNGHKIGSNDGTTWVDIQTGKAIQ
jgi:hypothetical protein